MSSNRRTVDVTLPRSLLDNRVLVWVEVFKSQMKGRSFLTLFGVIREF